MKKEALAQIKNYRALLKNIDERTDSLTTTHEKQMVCKKGCDKCCMAISVFPVEYYAIREALKEQLGTFTPAGTKDEEACLFLKDHNCQIYAYRPIICRTHGLPILYFNETEEGYELSLCELNFTDFDFSQFDDQNTLMLDSFNSQLFQINSQFVEQFNEKSYGVTDRIPLKNLFRES